MFNKNTPSWVGYGAAALGLGAVAGGVRCAANKLCKKSSVPDNPICESHSEVGEEKRKKEKRSFFSTFSTKPKKTAEVIQSKKETWIMENINLIVVAFCVVLFLLAAIICIVCKCKSHNPPVDHHQVGALREVVIKNPGPGPNEIINVEKEEQLDHQRVVPEVRNARDNVDGRMVQNVQVGDDVDGKPMPLRALAFHKRYKKLKAAGVLDNHQQRDH